MELAELQDQEVGDGTTSVVIVAAELLKRANELVRNKIHPTSIIIGYRLAMREVRRLRTSMQDVALAGLLSLSVLVWKPHSLPNPIVCQCRHASTSQRRWR